MHVKISEVRCALQDEKVLPFFQPLVDLRNGHLVGVEVLARWQSAELGPILPENFISLAQENGLIDSLMSQVLGKAAISASILPAPLVLATNISPIQLRDLSLPNQIRHIVERSGFPLDRLTIEITESALIDNLDRTQTIARELKAMGCKLALDDFGTGYSSLGHLQALPFDQLKIDKSFVQSMTKTRESRKIVAAIIGLGHSMGLTTVAEGVETEEQANMLLWLGCVQGQGWLYARPLPADRLPELIAAPPRPVSPELSTPGDGWAVSSLEALPTQRLAQLKAIYDGAPVGLCFLDRNLRYVSINQKLAEMNGTSIAAHLGRTVKEVIPESFPILEPYLVRALRGEASSDVEVSRPANGFDGKDWTAMLSYQPALDEADEVIGISIAVVDTTNQNRTREELNESDARQRQLIKPDDQVPWIMDADGNSLHISSRWVPAAELSRKKVRNLGWLEALHPDDLETTMKTMKNALRTGKSIDIEYRVMSLDGGWRWMRSRGSPRFGKSGEIVRWYGSVEDVNERERSNSL
jgi:PAS domain S-box-containing protein